MGKKLERQRRSGAVAGRAVEVPAPNVRRLVGPFTLRELEAELYRVVRVTTTEVDDGNPYPENKGMYVFRDEQGEKHLWSPRDFSFEFHPVKTLAEADHIDFLCPACFAKNGGAKGTHCVMVTFAGRNVSDDAGSGDSDGKPSRWNVSGTSLDDLVLTPSILLDAKRKAEDGCHWHGFVGSSGIPPGHAG